MVKLNVIEMNNIGKLERVDLRELWRHEEYDFSTWLSKEENLTLLGDTIGLDISLIERESSVGTYSVDIYAEEQGTGRKIIIENQLEETNHDHLGKIITYASGKDAKYIIWIVKKAKDEHRKAVEWLNSHTDSELCFFLLEIEIWRIGDSLPAPKFNVVERPNDWIKETQSTSKVASKRDEFCYKYWTEFIKFANSNTEIVREFKFRKPRTGSWYDISIGKRNCYIMFDVQPTKSTIDIGLYIPDDKKYFEELKSNSEKIEKIINGLEWRKASKACRLVLVKSIDVQDEDNWRTAFEWYLNLMPRFKQISNLQDIN